MVVWLWFEHWVSTVVICWRLLYSPWWNSFLKVSFLGNIIFKIECPSSSKTKAKSSIQEVEITNEEMLLILFWPGCVLIGERNNATKWTRCWSLIGSWKVPKEKQKTLKQRKVNTGRGDWRLWTVKQMKVYGKIPDSAICFCSYHNNLTDLEFWQVT